MPFNKPHLEFQRVDMNDGWFTPPGYPAGIKQKTLASDLDASVLSVDHAGGFIGNTFGPYAYRWTPILASKRH